jgi:hypothetical protein
MDRRLVMARLGEGRGFARCTGGSGEHVRGHSVAIVGENLHRGVVDKESGLERQKIPMT